MRIGCLSEEHLALIEFEKRCPYGKVLEEFDPFIREGGLYFRGMAVSNLLRSHAISKQPLHPTLQESAYTSTGEPPLVWKLTPEGYDYLTMRRKGGYFNIASDGLRRSMWALVGGIDEGATPFDREVLLEYGALRKEGQHYCFTKKGEKVSYKYLPEFLRYYCDGYAWTLEVGPNISLYTTKRGTALPVFNDWRRALKADFKLLSSIKGIGVPLMDNLSSSHKQYAALLLKASSYEEALDQIVESQLKDPDKFVFCNTNHDDIVNYLMRKAAAHARTTESHTALSMSNAR